jgi:hypothetical protein
MSHPVPARSAHVIAEIEAAFAGVERLSDDRMFEPLADSFWAERLLGGSGHWSAVPDSEIEYENAALTVVTPAGFRFFLPAYMCWVIRNPHSSSTAVDNTIHRLGDKAMSLHFVSLLKSQRRAVRSFLIWASETSSVDGPAAQRALEQVWFDHARDT